MIIRIEAVASGGGYTRTGRPGGGSGGSGGNAGGKGDKTGDASERPSGPGSFPVFPGGGVPGFPDGVPGGGIVPGIMLDEEEEYDEKAVERASQRTANAFEQCDKDFDGFITRVEAKGDVRTSFNRIDTDKSGDISNDELYDFYLGPPKKKKKKGVGAGP